MNNYFNYWYKRFLTDGFKSIKLVLGIAISYAVAFEINFIIGLMISAWVFVDTLIEKNSSH